jgi:hypothetical protein
MTPGSTIAATPGSQSAAQQRVRHLRHGQNQGEHRAHGLGDPARPHQQQGADGGVLGGVAVVGKQVEPAAGPVGEAGRQRAGAGRGRVKAERGPDVPDGVGRIARVECVGGHPQLMGDVPPLVVPHPPSSSSPVGAEARP